MNIDMVMKAVIKLAEDLTRLRLQDNNTSKEASAPEIDVTKEDKEYEDDEDEDFDDCDEEVDIL